jgi:hypothetical protein
MPSRKVLVRVIGLAALGVLPATVYCLLRGSAWAQAEEDEPALVLYSEAGFQGRSVTLTRSVADMPAEILADGSVFHWNDNVRSVRILRGTWRFYEHGRFNTELDETPLESFDASTKAPVSGWTVLVSAASSGEVRHRDGWTGGFGAGVSSVELVSSRNLPDWAVSVRASP